MIDKILSGRMWFDLKTIACQSVTLPKRLRSTAEICSLSALYVPHV